MATPHVTGVVALCMGAILAYPVAWSRRLAGAGLGLALILGLNTVRIGTLGRAAGGAVGRQETTTVPFIPLWIEQ